MNTIFAPFQAGQKVRYKAAQSMALQRRTVRNCEFKDGEWMVNFTDGPWAPNGKDLASKLEAVSSPVKVGDMVKTEIGIYTWKVVAIHEDRAWVECGDRDGVLLVHSLHRIPDMVTIEIPRTVAESYAEGWGDKFREVQDACKKALDQ